MAIAKNTPYRKELVALIHSIDRDVTPFRKEWDNDSISLNSEEEILKFVKWVESRKKGDKLSATK